MKVFRKASWASRFHWNSLRTQLLFRSLLILGLVLILVGSLQYLFMVDVIYRSRATALRSQVMSIPPQFWENAFRYPDYNQSAPPNIMLPDSGIALIDFNGDFHPLSLEHSRITAFQFDSKEYLEAMSRRQRPGYRVAGAGKEKQLVVFQPVRSSSGKVIGMIQISTLTRPLQELLLGQLFTFALLSIMALLLGLVAFFPLMRKTLKPLDNMVETVAQIDAGNLDRRFPTDQGQAEVDRLADSFNRMLEGLESAFAAEKETKEQMRRFIADASHELRTPLTSIQGFSEVLLRGAAENPEQLKQGLHSMHGESLRLGKLVHDLLLLSKLDRSPRTKMAVGFLDSIILDMEPQLRILAEGRRIVLNIEGEAECGFDPDQMRQVILNLFQNAVQHTDPGKGEIAITLSKEKAGICILVRDNGPGIEQGQIARIFDRFYRSDSSRTRKSGGAGLGLSISKTIIERHGGTIDVSSEEGQGSCFTILLPYRQ